MDDIAIVVAHHRLVNVVECRGLTKRYGTAAVVDGLELTVGAGQVFGFVGPNGAGKTTTLRMLLGLVHPSQGSMSVNGRLLPDPTGLAQVGAMIEEPSFYSWMSGRRNLETLARCGAPLSTADAIDRVLEAQGLTAVADHKVKTYSQGMRQRLGLAAAMMRSPNLLILDEPTNGRDPAGLRAFLSMVRDLADDGVTVLLSSHLLSEVEQVCDEVAVLDRGRVIEHGHPRELMTARAQVHVDVAPNERAVATLLLRDWPVRAGDAGELVVDTADARAVNEQLGRGGVWATRLAVVRPSLEDVFLALTRDDRGAG